MVSPKCAVKRRDIPRLDIAALIKRVPNFRFTMTWRSAIPQTSCNFQRARPQSMPHMITAMSCSRRTAGKEKCRRAYDLVLPPTPAS
jgi:hypothetical protein